VAINQLTKEGTMLITNARCYEILGGKGQVMANGDFLELPDGWTVDAVPAYNISPEKLKFHPKGRDNGFVLTIEGMRIYIAGDTEDIYEMDTIKDIDVAFLPCNLPYTMAPEQCAHAARMIKPAVLFPYHYGQTDIQQVVKLLEGSGIDVRIRDYQ
jgi:L-ascorbate metabolism protein UlaG (beta-lactamase superfamily)